MITESYKKRIQELAGVGLPKSEAQTLAVGFKEFEQVMGNGSIDKLINYIRKELKQPFIVSSIEEDKISFSNPIGYFLLFKGYMMDTSTYTFDIGHKDNMGNEVFTHELQFDMERNPGNLKSLNFNK